MVPPQLTRCCTQAGEAAAAGSMTCEASPPAILGCACKIPSRIQISPNPTRSSVGPRLPGSAGRRLPAQRPPVAGWPPRPGRGPQQPEERDDEQRDPPWCSSADLNAATSVGSAGFRPEFMPGTAFRVTPARLRPRPGPSPANMKKM